MSRPRPSAIKSAGSMAFSQCPTFAGTVKAGPSAAWTANVTGLAAQAAEISGKRLELLNQFVPGIHTVAVLEEPAAAFPLVALPLLQKPAEERDQQLVICNARSGDEVESGLAAAAKAGAGGARGFGNPGIDRVASTDR